MTNEYEDNSLFFCDTYEEKIAMDSPEIYGVYYEMGDDGKNCCIASNTQSELEYQIVFIPAGTEETDENDSGEYVIQEYSLNKSFLLPNDTGSGTLIINARNINNNEEIQILEIPYQTK